MLRWDVYIYIYCCDVMIMGKYQCIYSLTSKPALECKLCLTRLAWWEKIKTYVGFFDVFFLLFYFFPPGKVWQLGSSSPNFTLEGHEKGVNCIDYYSGGDKPYLISGADDRLVKIWDYQVCVQLCAVYCIDFATAKSWNCKKEKDLKTPTPLPSLERWKWEQYFMIHFSDVVNSLESMLWILKMNLEAT